MIFDGELNKNDSLYFQSEGIYGLLVDNSNIQVQYSTCISGKAYSSTFKNSKSQYTNCSGNSLLFEDVIWLNSIIDKDDESEKNILRQPSFYKTNLIQAGSYTGIKTPTNININSISGNGGIVDQDFFFSGYLINDGNKLYWSTLSNTNEFNNAGQFYKDSLITVTSEEFLNLLKIIPKNLNGYSVKFNISDNEIIPSIKLSDFYNGKLIINNIHLGENLICNNNNAEIAINDSNISGITNNILNCIHSTLKFSNTIFGILDNEQPCTLLEGYENKIYFDNTVSYYSISTIFNENNKTSNNNLIFESTPTISAITNALTDQYDSLLSSNSNLIQIKDENISIDSTNTDILFNHTHNNLYDNIFAYSDNLPTSSNFYLKNNLVFNTYQHTYSGVEIGSIFGWPQYYDIYTAKWLPKPPDGFYNCSIPEDNPLGTFEIPIDIANPTDKFFNGQLAELMGATTNDITFNIPEIAPISGMYLDENKTKCNRMIYIIKYNNNIEHNQTMKTIFEI